MGISGDGVEVVLEWGCWGYPWRNKRKYPGSPHSLEYLVGDPVRLQVLENMKRRSEFFLGQTPQTRGRQDVSLSKNPQCQKIETKHQICSQTLSLSGSVAGKNGRIPGRLATIRTWGSRLNPNPRFLGVRTVILPASPNPSKRCRSASRLRKQ